MEPASRSRSFEHSRGHVYTYHGHLAYSANDVCSRIGNTSMLTPYPEVAIAVRIVKRDSGNQVVVLTGNQALTDLYRQRSVIAITQFNQIEVSFLNRGFVGSFS